MTRFALKAAALLIIVALLQLLLMPRMQTSKHVRRFATCFAEHPDVVYYGDSVNAWTDLEDTDRRSIVELLGDLLPGTRVGQLSHVAFHSELFAAFFDLMIRRDLRPKASVIAINLRSFSPEWDKRPTYQLEDAKRDVRLTDRRFEQALDPVLRMLHIRPDASISYHDYQSIPVYHGDRMVGRVREFDNPSFLTVTPERTRDKLILFYMYRLQAAHRKLVAFRDIADLAREHRRTVLFYVTPIDVGTGERFLPGEFQRQVRTNVALIQTELRDAGAPVLDLSEALESEAFSWQSYPNEHLRENGRLIVAKRIAERLRELDVSFAAQDDKSANSPR